MPEILEATGARQQVRTSFVLMGIGSVFSVSFLFLHLDLAEEKIRNSEALLRDFLDTPMISSRLLIPKEAAKGLGIQKYMPKPLVIHDLAKTIRESLDTKA